MRSAYTNNPERDADVRDFEDYLWLKRRPVCQDCLEGITDEYYYEINGQAYCDKCLQQYIKWTDD